MCAQHGEGSGRVGREGVGISESLCTGEGINMSLHVPIMGISVSLRVWEGREGASVCACVCARAGVCVCVCACVRGCVRA